MENLQLDIESLIFAADEPIDVKQMQLAIESYYGTYPSEDLVQEVVEQIASKYNDSEEQVMDLIEINERFCFMSKTQYHGIIGAYLKDKFNKKLSKSALETLAIIAYKQPVSKPEIEAIRGVASDYGVQKLLEKELITILGRAELPGKPILYGTSQKFMNHFGLKNMADMPQLKEIMPNLENSIGDSDVEIPLNLEESNYGGNDSQSDSEE